MLVHKIHGGYMTKKEILEKSKYYARYKRAYMYVAMVFEFDHSTIAPKKGLEEGNEAMSVLMNDIFKTFKSEDYIEYVKAAYEKREEFSPEYKRLFELNYKGYKKEQNLSPELQYEYQIAANNAYTKWLEAKNKSDYSIFEPSLNKLVELTQKIISLREEKFATPYDSLLDDFEPGNNEVILDDFFSQLKARIVPLLKKIQNSKKQIRSDFLEYKISVPKQEKVSNYLLKFNGFDMSSGVLSTTEHPFTTFPSHHDVRVTTHYFPTRFASNMFSVIHEGGHGIFAQNEPDKFYEIGLAGSMTSAQHECMSRFYENLVGRNENYIHAIWKKISSICKKEYSDVSEKEFFEGVNLARASLIRTESDELTYCLHIMVRYEIEKDLINGKISTKDLNKEWNKRYSEYLGVSVSNDKEGILQDVHWSNGSFGYFPSYALGNAYASQILNTMKKDIDFDDLLKNGKLKDIKAWLKKKAFSIASLKDPNDWLKEITGEALNTDYYLSYLEEKFEKLFEL